MYAKLRQIPFKTSRGLNWKNKRNKPKSSSTCSVTIGHYGFCSFVLRHLCPVHEVNATKPLWRHFDVVLFKLICFAAVFCKMKMGSYVEF